MSTNNILLFYILLVAPISIALFLYGFFPVAYYGNAISTQLDIPEHVGNVSVKTNLLYKPMVTRLIIMVIDALRWDFVAGPVGKVAMPVTSSLLANSSGCLIKAKLQSPTVTMPRIKAMMTGTVPNFVDVILNFGSKPLNSDSLLLQAKKQDRLLVFYGDNIWLSLFPHAFKRHEGTTSFFVTDYIEVDNNVTRHIEDELNCDDWSMMILHYLGLDHIGHIEGPFGTSIKPKLQEMDEIINRIAQRVQYWNNDGIPALFVVCGDHGMKDSGGHGGSTVQETTVPLLMIGGTRCSHQENGEPIEIEQLDIAATLSAILGLPIPSMNLGSVFLNTIYDLPDAKRLFLLYYNSKQLLDYFQNLSHRDMQSASYKRIQQKYADTVKLHVTWLNRNENSSEIVEDIVLSYNAILKEIKNILISSMVKYDFRSMIAAMFLLCQILIIVFFVQNLTCTTYRKILYSFLKYFLLHLGICYVLYCTMSFYPIGIFNVLLLLIISSISSINICLCTNSCLSLVEFTKGTKIRGVLQMGILLHIASFASSSFVEEEHQTWYFLWASTIAYLLYHCSGKLFTYHRYCSYSRHSPHIQRCTKLLLLLMGHRVLRQLNSTGDKYAHLPNVAGWLKEDESKVGMTLLLLSALVLLIWIAYECENKRYKWQSLIYNIAIAICIYFRHMANGAVMKIPLYFPSSGILEVQTFWGIITLYLLSCSCRMISVFRHNKPRFASTIMFIIINIWVMISAILHQPYNVVLLPMQIIASSTIDVALRENDLFDVTIFVHCWLGNVFYFYQGNSNSLASIDIAAGYVGLRSYVPFVTGAYLIINTYSAPILAYFLLIYYRQLNIKNCADIKHMSRSYVAWRLLTVTVYTFIVIVQRHHLFVWSVFSPKLLYEAMYTVTTCCSVLLALIVITLQAALSNS